MFYTTGLQMTISWLTLVVLTPFALSLITNPGARLLARANSLSEVAMPSLKNARSLRRERRNYTLYTPILT